MPLILILQEPKLRTFKIHFDFNLPNSLRVYTINDDHYNIQFKRVVFKFFLIN